jgi:2-keto-4-pentenoate hydratase/2-oxohepta-3-ene-1,7-dioic acid hydratase in catechol pathway
VVIPRGRTQIDWECEFAVVVGKPAHYVSTAAAKDYNFVYSIEFDVSDRGGRGDRKMGGGPDWLVQKNHDTFAPLGPYIVPKEFVPNPTNTRHYFTLNGEIKQDSNTSRMDYNLWEMLSYASSIMTLNPGDMLSLGSPAGTNIERENPRWMRAGDVGVCVVEGIGEQRHNIVAQPQ